MNIMSDCCLTPCKQYLSYIYRVVNKLHFNEMMLMSTLFQTNSLVGFLQCQFTETTVRGQTCRSTRTHYSDSEPQSLLFHRNAVCFAEKQQKSILQSLVLSDRGSNPRSTALEASTLPITPHKMEHSADVKLT